MKLDTIIIIGAALAGVAAVAYFTRPRVTTGGATTTTGNTNASAGTTEIANTAGYGQVGYGWRYFTDGTAIDPDGNYYQAGNLIWAAGGTQ